MLMKKSYLILFLTFITFSLSAQIVRIDTVQSKIEFKPTKKSSANEIEYHYSVAIKALTIQQFPKLFKQLNSDDYYKTPLSGLVFKFNDNQISYRISGDYYYDKNYIFHNECADCEIMTGQFTNYSLKVGFEKNVNIGTIQPYFAFDIGYNNNKFKGEAMNAGAINFTIPYEANSRKKSAILGPSFGIKFNLINHIAIGAESGIDFLLTYETQEKAYNDAQRNRTFQKYNKVELLMRPLSLLSLQYNFSQED
ncbi:MAG: hypothetical protein JWN56_99 [Sphingobacteriales bacterium]|nr:hypothetical protein [Sphingobacteriales bacterium]